MTNLEPEPDTLLEPADALAEKMKFQATDNDTDSVSGTDNNTEQQLDEWQETTRILKPWYSSCLISECYRSILSLPQNACYRTGT